MPLIEAPASPASPVTPDAPSQLRRLGAAKPAGSIGPQHQELKFTLHRKLLDKINLDALASIETEKLRREVHGALSSLIDEEQTLLSATERNQIVAEVLDEVFGLGPLEPLLHDETVSDILVNTHEQVYIERHGKLELTGVTFTRMPGICTASSTRSSRRSAAASMSRPRWSTLVSRTARASTL